MTLEQEIISDFKKLNAMNKKEAKKAVAYIKLGQENANKWEEPIVTKTQKALDDFDDMCLKEYGMKIDKIVDPPQYN